MDEVQAPENAGLSLLGIGHVAQFHVRSGAAPKAGPMITISSKSQRYQ
jgi:hypothetical protein